MEQSPTAGTTPFELKDCALIAIALGKAAHNLRELRDHLQTLPEGAIYHHFWGSRLRAGFDDPEYNNDFASWAAHALHDTRTAEKLSLVNPTDFQSMEQVRARLLEIVEECLYEKAFVQSAEPGKQLNFITSQMVVLDTGRRIETPADLLNALPTLSPGSVFYHLIDARRRTPEKVDDFRVWLASFDDQYAQAIDSLAGLDPYFSSLTELRTQVEVALGTLEGGAL